MKEIWEKLKRSSRGRMIYLGLLLLLGLGYMGTEIRKVKLSHSLGSIEELSKADVMQLDSLHGTSVGLQIGLLAIIGLYALYILTGPSVSLLTFVQVHAAVLAVLAVIGLLLSLLFRASVLTMIQPLAGPAVIIGAVYFFYLVRQSFVKPVD